MLLDKSDFYDIHLLLTRIRFQSDQSYHKEMIRAVCAILCAPQKTTDCRFNSIRTALRAIEGIDKELYRWVYEDTDYTCGEKTITDAFCYSFLSRAFFAMLECAEREDWKRLEDLADALHNVPIFFADGCRNFKIKTKVEFHYYNKKYKTNLWKEFSK